MIKNIARYFGILFICMDVLALNTAFYLALSLRSDISIYGEEVLLPWLGLHFCWLAFFYLFRLYELERKLGIWGHLYKTFRTALLFSLFSFFTWNVIPVRFLMYQDVLYFLVPFGALLVLWRFPFFLFLSYVRKKGYNLRQVAILGYSREGRYLEHYFHMHEELGYVFVGYFDARNAPLHAKGTLEDLRRRIAQGELHIIYVVLSTNLTQEVISLISYADNHMVKVRLVPAFQGLGFENLRLQGYDKLSVLDISRTPLDSYVNRLLKRSVDIVFSLCVMVCLLAWMIPLLGLCIKMGSRGPIFFRQLRHGKDNQPFYCYKFRTMKVNIHADTKQTERDDPRITPIGKWLRKASIDELPQFFNVLMGDMSVVGPRPHALIMNEAYSSKVEKFWYRHSVKPGITGLAQAKGYRGSIRSTYEIRRRVRMDKFYVKNWSFLLDVKIMLLTLWSFIRNLDKSY